MVCGSRLGPRRERGTGTCLGQGHGGGRGGRRGVDHGLGGRLCRSEAGTFPCGRLGQGRAAGRYCSARRFAVRAVSWRSRGTRCCRRVPDVPDGSGGRRDLAGGRRGRQDRLGPRRPPKPVGCSRGARRFAVRAAAGSGRRRWARGRSHVSDIPDGSGLRRDLARSRRGRQCRLVLRRSSGCVGRGGPVPPRLGGRGGRHGVRLPVPGRLRPLQGGIRCRGRQRRRGCDGCRAARLFRPDGRRSRGWPLAGGNIRARDHGLHQRGQGPRGACHRPRSRGGSVLRGQVPRLGCDLPERVALARGRARTPGLRGRGQAAWRQCRLGPAGRADHSPGIGLVRETFIPARLLGGRLRPGRLWHDRGAGLLRCGGQGGGDEQVEDRLEPGGRARGDCLCAGRPPARHRGRGGRRKTCKCGRHRMAPENHASGLCAAGYRIFTAEG